MTDITLFEIHLHDASFTANAPGSGLPADEIADDDTGDSHADDDTDVEAGGLAGRTLIPKLVALLVVVVLVVLARRVVGGEDEPVPT